MKISSEKKKELLEQYKMMKPEMGLLAIINKTNGKYFLETTANLKGKLNRISFQFKMGRHPNKELQKDINIYGADQFEVTVLEQIEYEENDAKTDYSDDLKLLKMIWTDKLMQEGIKLY